MPEVRVMVEGSLRVVQASGSGATWATASAPVSALLGYITDFTYTSAQTVTTISDRGRPTHHKLTEFAPIDISFSFLTTGAFPSAVSGSGATVPMWHLEHRASAAEIGNGTTGVYNEILGFALQSYQFTEGKEGNKIALKGRALGIVRDTGSGFLS